MKLQEYQAAAGNLQSALDMRKRYLGEQHQQYAMTALNLAQVYNALGRFREAESLCHVGWSICRGETLQRQAGCFTIMSHIYARSDRAADAVRCANRALDLNIRDRSTPAVLGLAYRELCNVHIQAGRLPDAKAALDAAGRLDDDRAADRGRYLLASGDFPAASLALVAAMDEERRRKRPDPIHLAGLTADLGEATARGGDPAAGGKLLLEAVKLYETVLGPDNPRLARPLETYAELFPVDGKEHAARAAKLREAAKAHAPRGYEAVFGKE